MSTATMDTESRIRDAALHLFSQRGFQATGIRDLAKDAGITTAALYHYMGSKNDLLFDLVQEGLRRLIADAKESAPRSASGSEAIAGLMTAHVRFHINNPMLAHVIDTQFSALPEDRRAEVQILRDQYEVLWRRAIQLGRKNGEFEVAKPTIARLALLEMGNGVANWYRPSGRLTAARVAAEFSALALRLLGTCRESPVVSGGQRRRAAASRSNGQLLR